MCWYTGVYTISSAGQWFPWDQVAVTVAALLTHQWCWLRKALRSPFWRRLQLHSLHWDRRREWQRHFHPPQLKTCHKMLWMHTSGSDWTQTVTPLTRWRHVLPWKWLLVKLVSTSNLCKHKLCKVYPNVPQSTNTLTICWDRQLHFDQQTSLQMNKSACTQRTFKSREKLPLYCRLLIYSWSSIPNILHQSPSPN